MNWVINVIGAIVIIGLILLFAWAAWPLLLMFGLLYLGNIFFSHLRYRENLKKSNEVEVLLRQRCEMNLGRDYHKVPSKVFEGAASYLAMFIINHSDFENIGMDTKSIATSAERKLDLVRQASDEIIAMVTSGKQGYYRGFLPSYVFDEIEDKNFGNGPF